MEFIKTKLKRLNVEEPSGLFFFAPRKLARYIIVTIGLLALMYLGILGLESYLVSHNIPATKIPLPSDVINYLIKDLTIQSKFQRITLIEKILVSSRDGLYGFSISILLGTVIGVFFAKFNSLKQYLYPILFIIQLLPLPAFTPVIASALGYGITTKIVVIVLFTLFPVVIAVEHAVRSIPIEYYYLLRTFASPKIKTLFTLVLPGIVPDLFITMKILVTAAFVGSIIAELPLVVNTGIGKDLYNSFNNQIPLRVWSTLILISLTGILFFFSVSFIGKFIDKRYRYGRFE